MLQERYTFDYPEALATIDTLSQADVRELRDNFLKDVAIACSFVGNVQSQQAAKYAEIVKNKLVTGKWGCIFEKNSKF